MDIERILVIQGGKLGDMVCTTPVFRALKYKYPKAVLVVAGDSVNREIIRGLPYVDEYILLSELSVSRIKALSIDTSVLLTPNPNILWNLLRARIQKIIVPKVVGGFSPYATKKYRLLSLLATRVPHRMHHYAPGEYLKMLEPLGVTTSETAKELTVSPEALTKAGQLFELVLGKKKVAIAPGAGNTIKEWPPENFNAVARHFAQMGNVIVIIGGMKDRALADKVKIGIPADSVIDTVGSLTLEELKAVVKGVDLFISADTGPIYIAEAFGVPTVDIVGPVDEREQPPQGPKHIVIVPPNRKKPELFVLNARVYNREAAEELSRSTPVELVIETAKSLLHD